MKKNNSIKNVLAGVVCVYLGLICGTATCGGATKKPDAAASGSEAGSAVTVNRSPSVGSGVFVTLSVDGKRVKTLIKGSVYRGTLPPGKHVLSVLPDPNTTGQRENKVELTVEKDHAYSLIVARSKAGELVLTKSP
jgi:hypothetical protein